MTLQHVRGDAPPAPKPIGFWGCWSLVVGTMIGSGIFSVPAVLAPFGAVSFGGWLISAGGAILIALTIGRLAGRTRRTGGLYVYTQDAFGDAAGFLIAWGYWASLTVAVPAVAIAFVGYLTVFIPRLTDAPVAQAAAALALVWSLIGVALRGARNIRVTQIVLTILKLFPLVLIVVLGMAVGEPSYLSAAPLKTEPLPVALSATALLTMWAFLGLETASMPAGDVDHPERTIARATIFGTASVAAVYVACTLAVMMLIPLPQLAQSTAPFADAIAGRGGSMLGDWGPYLISAGALVAIAGTTNGSIFAASQVMMAVAGDKLAPAALARRNPAGAPYMALVIGGVVSSILLVANYSRGLMGAFTFLLMMSTVTTLTALLAVALAEVRASWRTAKGWAVVAGLACCFAVFAIVGSGLETMAWGVVLMALGWPAYRWGRP